MGMTSEESRRIRTDLLNESKRWNLEDNYSDVAPPPSRGNVKVMRIVVSPRSNQRHTKAPQTINNDMSHLNESDVINENSIESKCEDILSN